MDSVTPHGLLLAYHLEIELALALALGSHVEALSSARIALGLAIRLRRHDLAACASELIDVLAPDKVAS